jgi:hypothetical protein
MKLPKVSNQPCPAVKLGEAQKRFHILLDQAETAKLSIKRGAEISGAEMIRAERRIEIIYEKIFALDDEISWVRAITLEGALYQVAAAHCLAKTLEDGGMEPWQVKEKQNALERILYSIRHAIEGATGLKLELTIGENYMLAERDPFLILQENAA